MSKEQQIDIDIAVEEMASAIREITVACCKCEYYKDGSCLKPIDMGCDTNEDILNECDALYNANYRKQSEGEWVLVQDKSAYGDNYFICSVCEGKCHSNEFGYCPNCAAKMKRRCGVMRILSQTNDMQGYHGTIGTPTNMYDFYGHQLFVGDVVALTTCGIDGKLAYNCGINFVCEENTKIANWTNQDRQYVMGISNVYNNTQFKQLEGVELDTEEWQEKMDLIDPEWRVLKVKDYSCLAIGEKISFLSVVEVADHQNKKGGE